MSSILLGRAVPISSSLPAAAFPADASGYRRTSRSKQSINVAVLNPWFFAVFFGTAAGCLVVVALALLRWNDPGTFYLLVGSVLYLLGSILVTIAFSVPLNEALAAVNPNSTEGAELWTRYLSVWTAWNHVRTAGSLAAAASFIMALR